MDAREIGRMMMAFGVLLLAVGAFLYFGGRLLPFGHLPGDFHWGGESAGPCIFRWRLVRSSVSCCRCFCICSFVDDG